MTRFAAMVVILFLSTFSKSDTSVDSEIHFDDPFVAVEVIEDPQSIFHVRLLVRRTYGDLGFKVLVLKKLGGNFSTLEVPIKTTSLDDGLEEAWIHIFGLEELKKYAVVAIYELACADQKGSCTDDELIEYRRDLGRSAT